MGFNSLTPSYANKEKKIFKVMNFYGRKEKICRKLSNGLFNFVHFQVLVPSESKTLHLYEARYLALLEEVLKVHVTHHNKILLFGEMRGKNTS